MPDQVLNISHKLQSTESIDFKNSTKFVKIILHIYKSQLSTITGISLNIII